MTTQKKLKEFKDETGQYVTFHPTIRHTLLFSYFNDFCLWRDVDIENVMHGCIEFQSDREREGALKSRDSRNSVFRNMLETNPAYYLYHRFISLNEGLFEEKYLVTAIGVTEESGEFLIKNMDRGTILYELDAVLADRITDDDALVLLLREIIYHRDNISKVNDDLWKAKIGIEETLKSVKMKERKFHSYQFSDKS